MTRQRAAQILDEHRDPKNRIYAAPVPQEIKDLYEAYRMGADALKECHWIPVEWHKEMEEYRSSHSAGTKVKTVFDCPMPDDRQKIYITQLCEDEGKTKPYVLFDICQINNGDYSLLCNITDWTKVIAWMPYPEPYEAEKISKSTLVINTPKTCGECPLCIFTADEKRHIGFCNTSDEDYYCKALDRFMEYNEVDGGLDILGKPSDCPLTESEDRK